MKKIIRMSKKLSFKKLTFLSPTDRVATSINYSYRVFLFLSDFLKICIRFKLKRNNIFLM